jgi:hypothetical protein
MKTQKSLYLVLMLSIISLTAFSSNIAGETKAKQALNASEQIKLLVKYSPVGELMPNESDCIIYVIFSINDNQELEVVKVFGRNQDLVKHTSQRLSKASVKINGNAAGDLYKIPVHYKNGSVRN